MYYVGQLVYYELNIDYIIETYCINKEKPELQCNGKCHLAKQLQLTKSSDNNKSVNILIEAFFPVYLHSFEFVDISITINYLEKESNSIYQNNYTHLIIPTIYKPPIC